MSYPSEKQGWVIGRFKEFSVLQRGKDLTDNEVIPGEYPVVKSNGIQIHHNAYFVDPPGVVTGRSGTIGKVFYINEPFWAHNTTLYVKDFKDSDPKFIYYLIQKMDFRRYYAGTTVPTLNRNDIHRLKVEVPESKYEQKAIAGILSKVDEAIETIEKSIEAAEKVKKSLMQNLLTGKLQLDGTLRPDEDFYNDDKLGKVPKGWNVKKLSEIFEVNKETLPSTTDPNYKFRYITIESVSTESIDYNSCPKYAFKDSPGRARRIINSGDILISGVRPNLKSFAIYQKPNNENWICSTGFFVLTPKESEDGVFHFYQILGFTGEKQFYSYVAGTNYPAIGDRDLRKMKLLQPPPDEQKAIGERISLVEKSKEEKKKKIESLKILKKSLMQNLLTGKVRVNSVKINALLEELD